MDDGVDDSRIDNAGMDSDEVDPVFSMVGQDACCNYTSKYTYEYIP